jgi:hypothetical protein
MKWGIYARAGQIAKAGSSPTYFTINSYYDDSDGTSLCTAEPRGTPTVYSSTYSTIATAFTNSSPIYSNPALSTLAPSGYYTDTLNTTYYFFDRGAWSTSTSCPR